MKISVIVPIYKVEAYLEQCIASLKRQAVPDIEFILVDDGSPDNCGEIAERAAGDDKRFKVFHKKNGGLISAWKYGLERSSGDYIGFVDSDDYIEDNMFMRLCELSLEYGADLVCCRYYLFNDEHKSVVDMAAAPGYYDRSAIERDILPYVISNGHFVTSGRAISSVRWNKLFKRELLIDNMKYFDESVSFGEDLIVTYSAVAKARSIYITDDILYNFRNNPNSMTHVHLPNLRAQVDRCDELLIAITEDFGLDTYEQIYINDAITANRLIRNVINDSSLKGKQKRLAIKDIVASKGIQKGSELLLTSKDLSFKNKVRFSLFKNKRVFLIYLYFLIVR